MTLTKTDLVKKLHERYAADKAEGAHSGVLSSEKQCAGVVQEVIDELTRGLLQEKTIEISGFGSFEISRKANKSICFKPSRILEERINNLEENQEGEKE